MKARLLQLYVLLAVGSMGCTKPPPVPPDPYANPAAPGFRLAESDSLAIQLADTLMYTMGNRLNWDSTRFLQWNFFGMRRHLWDRHTGRVRIESLRDSVTYLINVRDSTGIVYEGRQALDSTTTERRIRDGVSIWINDSYWLIMPFKLKDSGTRLRYLGDSLTQGHRPAHLLELTFAGVGDTPDNKYHVWIDKKSGLVGQWAFFKTREDPKPLFVNEWSEYATRGKIMLSGRRGKNALTEIAVLDSVPERLFREL